MGLVINFRLRSILCALFYTLCCEFVHAYKTCTVIRNTHQPFGNREKRLPPRYCSAPDFLDRSFSAPSEPGSDGRDHPRPGPFPRGCGDWLTPFLGTGRRRCGTAATRSRPPQPRGGPTTHLVGVHILPFLIGRDLQVVHAQTVQQRIGLSSGTAQGRVSPDATTQHMHRHMPHCRAAWWTESKAQEK